MTTTALPTRAHEKLLALEPIPGFSSSTTASIDTVIVLEPFPMIFRRRSAPLLSLSLSGSEPTYNSKSHIIRITSFPLACEIRLMCVSVCVYFLMPPRFVPSSHADHAFFLGSSSLPASLCTVNRKPVENGKGLKRHLAGLKSFSEA